MRALARSLRRLNAVDWSQLHAKVAGAVWGVLLFVLTPNVLGATLGAVLVWVLTGMVVGGALLSATGLVIAARLHEADREVLRADLARSLRGLGLELIGIIMMLVAIALYFLSQAVLSFGPQGDQRAALAGFAYFTFAMVLGRFYAVRRRRRKETDLAAFLGGTA